MQTNSVWFRKAVFKVTRMHRGQVDDSSFHCPKLVEFLFLRMVWIYILPDMEGIHAGQAYFKQYLESCR